MTVRPAQSTPPPAPLLPVSYLALPPPRGSTQSASNALVVGRHTAMTDNSTTVAGSSWRSRTPTDVRALKCLFVHGSLQVAALAPPAAVLLDLAAPSGPSVLNPMGQAHTDASLYALFVLVVSNGIAAPAMARAILRLLAAPSSRWLTQPHERRSAALHGCLGATVVGLTTLLALRRLQEEIAYRGALTGWEAGAFPNSYYWHALNHSMQACVPLLAFLGYHAASYVRGCQLLEAERDDATELMQWPPQP